VKTPPVRQLPAMISGGWQTSSGVADRSEYSGLSIGRQDRAKDDFLVFFRGGMFSLLISLSERTSSELDHESSLSEDGVVRRGGTRNMCVSWYVSKPG
jgi:hypothetical protein